MRKIYLSVEQVSEIFNVTVEDAYTSAVVTGGFMAAKFFNMNDLPVKFRNYIPDVDSYYIIISSTIVKDMNLTEKEVDAVIYHEEGHIAKGHMDTENPGFMNDQEHENEADDYAISKGYGLHLANALTKIVAFITSYNKDYESEIEPIQKRIDRILSKI